MKKVYVYSVLLVLGLVLSQWEIRISGLSYEALAHTVKVLTMGALAFIMIRVGYEFDIDKSNLKPYGWDYLVAATAAAFPWIFCTLYFLWVLLPSGSTGSADAWSEALLTARFASPTSAGVLFSMLVAAGLGATWVFRKTRILAIFDDVDTVLFMIPLKVMMVGLKWQLGVILVVVVLLLWLAWKYLHVWRIPITWTWVLFYSAVITGVCEAIYFSSHLLDEVVPIHIEVLLPAFVLGCIVAKPKEGASDKDGSGVEDLLESPSEMRASTIISACFMILIGLSMPPLLGIAGPTDEVLAADEAAAHAYIIEEAGAIAPSRSAIDGAATDGDELPWGTIALHVLAITLLSNLGKMFPAFCYRKQVSWRQRLAVAVAMFPRGEVGAGVLIISLSYGIGGMMIVVAMFSLALNLLLTGVFIIAVKKLINSEVEGLNSGDGMSPALPG